MSDVLIFNTLLPINQSFHQITKRMENQILDSPSVALPRVYAGFWLRVAAYIIDAILLSIVNWILTFLVVGSSMSAAMMSPDGAVDPAAAQAMMSKIWMAYGISLVIGWLYFAYMESSKNQGTLGKMALSIKVTDMDGNRISFGRATGRFFAKLISGLILLIGYIMVAFTEKRQGLHDMIANTLVVKK